MIERRIDVNKLRLAKLKFFDKKMNGVEVGNIDAYAILIMVDGQYINLLDVSEDILPVFERLHCSNTTQDGESFGTKLRFVSGDLKTGMCYVLEQIDLKDLFHTDTVSMEEVERYVMYSTYFFPIREEIIKNSDVPRKMKRAIRKIVELDRINKERLNKYFSQNIGGFQYIK